MTHSLTNHHSCAQVGDRIATYFFFFFVPAAPTRALATTNKFSPAVSILRNCNTILIMKLNQHHPNKFLLILYTRNVF